MCGSVLQLHAFALKSVARREPYTHCRTCQARLSRDHYDRNRAQYKARVAANNARYIRENRLRLIELLAGASCSDCGVRDASVLEFDHRDPAQKSADVSRLLQTARSWRAIEAEIRKCDVVCANCHRKRTARQFGWAKAVGLGELALPPLPTRGTETYERVKNMRKVLRRRHRNAAALLAYLCSHPCATCGEPDPIVLDFDHVDTKRADLSAMWPRFGLSALVQEIAACRVLCANCHRRHTATAAGRHR